VRYGVVEAAIHILEQQPRSPVAHPHLARGLRQRARARNAFEKFDLAEADRTLVAEVDAKSHREGICHVDPVLVKVSGEACGLQ
jgi:hypothetical protein